MPDAGPHDQEASVKPAAALARIGPAAAQRVAAKISSPYQQDRALKRIAGSLAGAR
ncbi:MAG: hypothetical protein JWL99_4593 [Streptomyces oryziradicis]|uniref:hypothetical protein n=1 Tax=Actinacidiphila oryziradicis TaxID=2571141 RepID=UPI00145DBEB6|nr:hypothetical protein [Actinacidiphila oryziradicis]MCW2873273.1 hypothetical protein [Actinacidiphila oryziradicis]